MKRIFKQYTLANKNLVLTLAVLSALRAQGLAGDVSSEALAAEVLGGLSVKLVSPKQSGVAIIGTNSSAQHYYGIDDNDVAIHLSNLSAGQHRLTVNAEYGTYVHALFVCDIYVPKNAGDSTDTQSENFAAVEGIGDGQGSSVTVDSEITAESQNPVTSAAIYEELAGKQPKGTYADGTKYKVGTIAGGKEYSQIDSPCAIGTGVSVKEEQVCVGKFNRNDTITDETVVFQVGIGTAPNARKDGFAITAAGNLVLYNNGTPVILTPAKLAQLIS